MTTVVCEFCGQEIPEKDKVFIGKYIACLDCQEDDTQTATTKNSDGTIHDK